MVDRGMQASRDPNHILTADEAAFISPPLHPREDKQNATTGAALTAELPTPGPDPVWGFDRTLIDPQLTGLSPQSPTPVYQTSAVASTQNIASTSFTAAFESTPNRRLPASSTAVAVS